MVLFWILFGGTLGVLGAWLWLRNRHRQELAAQNDSLRTQLQIAADKTALAVSERDRDQILMEEAIAQRDSATERAVAFEMELTANRTALEQARDLASERGDKLRAAKTEIEDLRARLAAEVTARVAAERHSGQSPAQQKKSDEESLTLRRYREENDPDHRNDDLTLIRGIGAVLEHKLHELGITTFRQIAELSPTEIARLDQVLNFPGRIEREKWVQQARSLSKH